MHTFCLNELVSKFDQFIKEGFDMRRPGPPPKLSLAQLAAVCIVRSALRIPCWGDLFENSLIKAGWRAMGGFDLAVLWPTDASVERCFIGVVGLASTAPGTLDGNGCDRQHPYSLGENMEQARQVEIQGVKT